MANSADKDQTAPEEQSDQGLHCLSYTVGFYTTSNDKEIDMETFIAEYCSLMIKIFLVYRANTVSLQKQKLHKYNCYPIGQIT